MAWLKAVRRGDRDVTDEVIELTHAPETRLIRAVRPDHSGEFNVVALPPGAYLIAAVDYVEPGQWLDPEYLESLRSRARRVTFEAGQKIDIELSLIGG